MCLLRGVRYFDSGVCRFRNLEKVSGQDCKPACPHLPPFGDSAPDTSFCPKPEHTLAADSSLSRDNIAGGSYGLTSGVSGPFILLGVFVIIETSREFVKMLINLLYNK